MPAFANLRRPLGLLIDLDGTLADTLPDFVAALSALAHEKGWEPPPVDTVRHAIGRGSAQLLREMLVLWAQPADSLEAVLARYQQHYTACNGRHARAFEGAASTLRQLSQSGITLACVTNKPQALAEALLAQLQLREDFVCVVGAEPGRRAKPHPDGLLEAAAQLRLDPARLWMVGDSRNDFEAAQAAGCSATVLLRHGYNHGEPIDAVPSQAVLERLPDLLPLVLSAPS